MPELLKNFFNKKTVNILIDDFKSVYPEFDSNKFIKIIFDKDWENRELKERMHHIALCLHKVLPEKFEDALSIILKVANERLPHRKTEFADISLSDFVSTFGLEYPEISLNALAVLTPFPSSEFAVRPFIIKYPDLSLKKFYEWSKSKNHHVRRFASEGCRPRLPWGMAILQFKKDPLPLLPILETLMNDSSEYVRKSVANNLNDISKDNPEILLQFVKKWFGKSDNVNWILKHASRTLLKNGNETALNLFGFDGSKKIKVSKLVLKPEIIKIGGKFEFSFSLTNKERHEEKIRLEYRIYFVKSNGRLSPKIFKISEAIFQPGREFSISRRHSFIDMTTRKHFKGRHKISIVVNGVESVQKEFVLI